MKKSKEQIFGEDWCNGDQLDVGLVHRSMEKYAEQEAIAFAEWTESNDYVFFGGAGKTWYKFDDHKRRNVFTTKQLYTIYKSQ